MVTLLEKAGLVGSGIDIEVVKHNDKGLPVLDADGNPVTIKQKVFIERSDFRDMKPLQIIAMFTGDDKVKGVFSPEQISDLSGLTEENLRPGRREGQVKVQRTSLVVPSWRTLSTWMNWAKSVPRHKKRSTP